jgi:hypothetical protein
MNLSRYVETLRLWSYVFPLLPFWFKLSVWTSKGGVRYT